MTTTAGLQLSAAGVTRVDVDRRDLRADDVDVQIDFCGVCHTDLHALHALQQGSGADVVPGHEATGRVLAVGRDVSTTSVGDRVAVGNIVDSCGRCSMCRVGQENFCREFPTLTYGGTDRHDGSTTQGLWAGRVVVSDRFVHPLPAGLDPASAAPLLCAGVTVWEPLRALHVGPGTKVAVVGLGGLGHLAVKLAVALGAEVTVVSRTHAKGQDARDLGAHEVLLSSDEGAMSAARDRFDVIIDTVPAVHDLAPLLRLVALDGTLCVVGALERFDVSVLDLLVGRKRLTGAGSGGVPATREMLQFCADHGVTADVEMVTVGGVGTALQRLEKGDVRYRFVVDTAELHTLSA